MIADPHHVIPVAADLQRRDCGFVADREAGRKLNRCQHRVLQRQRRFACGLELAHVLDCQAQVTDEHSYQQPIFRADPARYPKFEPQRDVATAGEHRDDSGCHARVVRLLDRLHRERQLMTGLFKYLAQRRIELAPWRDGGFAGHLNRRVTLVRWPYRGHHPVHIEREATLVKGDCEHFGHAFGYTDRGCQPQHRAFPRGERALGGDVANRSDVHVAIGNLCRHPVDIDRYPLQSAVPVPDRRLVLDLVLLIETPLLEPRGLLVDQPRMRPLVGETIGRVAGDLAERVVDLGDGPFVVCHEESLLQRIHQGGAELVAIGKVFGPGALFLVTLCAV